MLDVKGQHGVYACASIIVARDLLLSQYVLICMYDQLGGVLRCSTWQSSCDDPATTSINGQYDSINNTQTESSLEKTQDSILLIEVSMIELSSGGTRHLNIEQVVWSAMYRAQDQVSVNGWSDESRCKKGQQSSTELMMCDRSCIEWPFKTSLDDIQTEAVTKSWYKAWHSLRMHDRLCVEQ